MATIELTILEVLFIILITAFLTVGFMRGMLYFLSRKYNNDPYSGVVITELAAIRWVMRLYRQLEELRQEVKRAHQGDMEYDLRASMTRSASLLAECKSNFMDHVG